MNGRPIRADLMRQAKVEAQAANLSAPAPRLANRQRLALTVPVGAVIAMNKFAKDHGHSRSQVLQAVRILRKLEWSR